MVVPQGLHAHLLLPPGDAGVDRGALRLDAHASVAGRGTAAQGPIGYNPEMNTTILLLLLGLGVGVFSGMVGIGGGILIVPALMFGFGFTQLRAQGTSTAMLLPP